MPIFRKLLSSRWLQAGGVLLVLGGGYWFWSGDTVATRYVTASVGMGDIQTSIVTTGTINPVATVTVGTYVSGPIKEIFCDYNTQVKAGQLCAKIDPRNYEAAVQQDRAALGTAEAQLKKDEAALAYAKVNHERDRRLLLEGIVSQDEVDSDLSAWRQAEAQVELDRSAIIQRKATLSTSETNLAYTDITSPVDGTVVSRSVEVGQTVAASFSTPTLFLIAKDLKEMQIDTNVSETDISGAKEGQKVIFTVEAYAGEPFTGRVRQVRMAPQQVQNIITYNVVVGVDNPDLKLLPGMTANARIVTDEVTDAMYVPQQALRYTPSALKSSGKPARGDGAHVWVLRDGESVRVAVKTGIDDGNNIQIISGDLREGERVITDEASATPSAKTNAAPSTQRPPFRF